jgi:Tfp pilus assembly protein PilF
VTDSLEGIESSDPLQRAIELWEEGYRHQLQGELDSAIDRYRQSLELHPTAEAHTFLGWALSFQGRLSEAIEHCLRAIEIDPEFGNPYNDIGVYLMQQGQADEAIPWLEKAKSAPRYEPRQFPFINLGRIYLKQGKVEQAMREFEAAVRLAPDDPGTRHALVALRARSNGHA